MRIDADIDIDFADRNQALKLIKHVPARQESNVDSKQHNSGVYVTDIPYDPIHNCANIDYKEADSRGYFKIDFLNMHVYKSITSYDQYNELLNRIPPWDKILNREFCSKVVHISEHAYLVQQMKPDSIARMAMFLAVIRPAKKYLIGKSWEEISKEIWAKPENDEYYFKKAHALSYATLVALHMNIIDLGLEQEL